MAPDRRDLLLTRHSLRRRFQQNQEDCTITVLELLPTVAENVIEALPAERISKEIQQKKAERMGRSTATSDVAPSDFSSGTPSVTDEDGRSMRSSQSESYVHASQMGDSSAALSREGQQKTKVQLWTDLKIIGDYLEGWPYFTPMLTKSSHHSSIHPHLHPRPFDAPHSHPIEPSWKEELPCERCVSRLPVSERTYHPPRESR